jgi:hypothetical protein
MTLLSHTSPNQTLDEVGYPPRGRPHPTPTLVFLCCFHYFAHFAICCTATIVSTSHDMGILEITELLSVDLILFEWDKAAAFENVCHAHPTVLIRPRYAKDSHNHVARHRQLQHST